MKIHLSLILLTWRIWRAPNNARKRQMVFNSAFKGLSQRKFHICNFMYRKPYTVCLILFPLFFIVCISKLCEKDVERFANLPGTSQRDRWPLLLSSLPAPPPSTTTSSSITSPTPIGTAREEWAVLTLLEHSVKHASRILRETEAEAA